MLRRDDSINGSNSRTPLLPNNSNNNTYLRTAGVLRIIKTVLFSNYINVMLIFLPLGIISGALGWTAPFTFVFNFLAISALASLLSFATEELSKEVGQTLGGLLN